MSGKPLGQKIKRLHDRLDNLRKLTEAEPKVAEILDKLLDSLDGEAVSAVENANRVLELATLNKIGQAFSSSATLKVETILELVCGQTSLLMDTNNFYVAFYDAYGDAVSFPLAVEEGTRQKPIGEWAPRKAGRGFTEYIIRHGDALFIPNNVNEWISTHYDEVELIGRPAKSWLGVPMIAADQIIGVIAVQNYHREDTYDHHDLDILSTIASQAAIAITNARLFQSTQRQVEDLRLLREVGQAITSTIEPKEVIRYVVQGARRVIGADIAALYPLVDGEFQRPVIDGETHTEHKLDPLPRIGGIASKVLEKGFVIVEDVEKEPKMSSRFTKTEGISSFAGVALRVGGQVVDGELIGGKPIGVLYVDFRNGHSFTEDESNKVNLFATQAAIAIQNARLFEQIRSDLNRRIEELDALVGIDEAITTLDLDTVLDRIIEAACRIVAAPNGNIMLVDESGEYVELKAARGAPWVEGTRTKFKIGEHGVTGWVAEHKRTALIPDVRADEWQDIYLRVLTDTQSELAVPLLDENDELLGVINLESHKPAAFSEDDQRLLEALARQAVIAIQNQKRYEAVQRARRELETLSEVDKAISSTLELDRVLQLILDKGLELMDVPTGDIMLFDKVKGDLWMAVERGVAEKHKRTRQALGQGIVGIVAEQRRSLRVSDVVEHPWNEIYLGFIPNTRSELAVPMLRDGRLVGIINAESPRYGAFSADDQRLLEALAGQAVIAIQNAAQYQRLEALREIDRAIISALDSDRVLDLILDNALQLIGAEIGELRLVDSATKELVVRSSRIPQGAVIDEKWTRIPPGHGITGWCVEHRRSVIVADAEQDSRYIPYFQGMRSEVAVPLLLDKEALGVVSLESPQVGAFDEYDLRLLETLAGQAVVAIENARLLEQARKEREERIEAIREIGVEITAGASLTELLDELLQRTVRLTKEASMGGIWLLDEVTGKLKVHAVRGDVEVEITELAIGEGIVGWVAQTEKSYLVGNVAYDSHFVRGLVGTRSELAVPMFKGDRLIGVLNIEHPEPDAFVQEDIALLEAIASQVVIAIENARLMEQERWLSSQVRRGIEAIREIGVEITAGVSLTQVLEDLLHRTVRLLKKASVGEIWLLDEGTEKLKVYAAQGDVETEVTELAIGEGIVGWVVQTRKPYLTGNVEGDPHFVRRLGGTQSELAVPMFRGDQLIGVLNMEHPEPNAFTREDIPLLGAIASQVVIAVENARLFEEKDEALEAKDKALKELREEQKKSAAAARLTAVNAVAGEFVHRMNNVAGTIPARVEQIRELLDPSDPVYPRISRFLGAISEDSESLLSAAKAIKSSDLDEGSLELVDADALVSSAIQRIAMPPGMEVYRTCEEALPPVLAFSGQLVDVLENIIRNGLEAIEGSGIVTIECRKVVEQAQDWVAIDVQDTGRGILPQNLPKVFELFFSTKPGSMGFALWRAKTLVESLGGRIDVSSEVGKGTTFTILLPVA